MIPTKWTDPSLNSSCSQTVVTCLNRPRNRSPASATRFLRQPWSHRDALRRHAVALEDILYKVCHQMVWGFPLHKSKSWRGSHQLGGLNHFRASSFYFRPDGRIDFKVDLPFRPAIWLLSAVSLNPETGLAFLQSPIRVMNRRIHVAAATHGLISRLNNVKYYFTLITRIVTPGTFRKISSYHMHLLFLQLDTTRPFYITAELPSSAFKGEQLAMQVSIFNYWDQPMEVGAGHRCLFVLKLRWRDWLVFL